MNTNTEAYNNLYSRNWPIIPREIQQKIAPLKVAVAGCGSTGGAVVDGLSRLGVQDFHLCDNGDYELNNLNRQFVFGADIGRNKSMVHAERLEKLNPFVHVKTWTNGLTTDNIDAFLNNVDFLFDAVDVTTTQGMKIKLHLHEEAARRGIPTGSALDLGYLQWLQSYNYQLGEPALHGRLRAAQEVKNPLKALIVGFCDVEELSHEITLELTRLIKDPQQSCSQLAAVCFVLAGMMTPYMLHFLSKGRLPALTRIDLMTYFEDETEKQQRKERSTKSHKELTALLQEIP